jgi:K+-transporting ATPase A subunit
MANKQKKKRNKQYRGADAALQRPVVTKISAANRSKLGQWWFDRKRILKPILIGVAVIIGIIWLVLELIRVVSQ